MYNKNLWKSGEIISDTKLNRMENGISENDIKIRDHINNHPSSLSDSEKKNLDSIPSIKEQVNIISASLDNKANLSEVRKNNVLIDTKDITDNLRQQINGNAPIMQSLEDGIVTPIKTSFFDIEVDYRNILNIEESKVGALDTSNGGVSPNDNFTIVEFIPVTENTNYVFSINGLVSANLSQICYYKADKTFISSTTNINTFITPNECAFISVSVYGAFNKFSQIEKGTSCTQYVAYKTVLRNNGIKEEYLTNVINKINPLEKQLEQLFSFEELSLVIQNGFYSDNVFTTNGAYESVKIECLEGEKYLINCYILGVTKFPVVRYYNDSFKEISNTGALTTDTIVNNFEITIPKNVKYFTVTNRVSGNIKMVIKKYIASINSTSKKCTDGLKYIALGDSITATSNRWRDQFQKKTGAKEILCTAVAGAHLADYPQTVLDGINFDGYGNTVCNQVTRILKNPPAEIPDFIIISAITNDTLSYDVLNKEEEVFFNSDGYTYSNIDNVDRTCIEGAMRWIVENLYTLYPNTKIFFASPIQAFETIRATWNILMKEDKIIRIARKLNVKVIKASSESGIYGRYENNGTNGKYLSDGLHPNVEGGIVLGNYYASQVINYFSYI